MQPEVTSAAPTCRNHPDLLVPTLRCARCGASFCRDCLVMLQARPYCADCKMEHVRDAASGVDATKMPLASIGKRFLAFFIDGMIVGIPAGIIVIAIIIGAVVGGASADSPMINFVGLISLPIMIVYEGILLSRKGQTFGKMALKLKVVRPDGSAISTGQAWGRAVVRGLLPSLLALANYLPAFFTADKTALHDMAAKTRVVELV